MAFKEITLLSTMVALAILSCGLTMTEACMSNTVDSTYDSLKTSMYNIIESVNNLFVDSQKEIDLYNMYMEGKMSFEDYMQAMNELYKTQNQYFQYLSNYMQNSYNLQNSMYNSMTMPTFYMQTSK